MQLLQHNNIIPLRDTFYIDKKAFIVMDLASNIYIYIYIAFTMRDAMKDTMFEMNYKYFTFKFAREMADALNFMHMSEIVHLDLKPENVLISKHKSWSDWSVLIADFGISNKIPEELYTTTYKGTPAYVAPEIWEGSQFKYEPDIFALGVMMFELYTQQLPWKSNPQTQAEKLIDEILKEDVNFDRFKAEKKGKKTYAYQKAVVEVIQKCLCKDRKLRISSWDLLSNKNYIYIYICIFSGIKSNLHALFNALLLHNWTQQHKGQERD